MVWKRNIAGINFCKHLKFWKFAIVTSKNNDNIFFMTISLCLSLSRFLHSYRWCFSPIPLDGAFRKIKGYEFSKEFRNFCKYKFSWMAWWLGFCEKKVSQTITKLTKSPKFLFAKPIPSKAHRVHQSSKCKENHHYDGFLHYEHKYL